jgi:hypothetical protein
MIYMIVPVLLAAMVGFLHGGRLRNLAKVRLRASWIPLAMFSLQFGVVLFPQGQSELFLGLRPWAMIVTYASLIAFLWVNRRLPGMKLILLGAALNLAVILANGGYMPVTSEALMRSGHLDLVFVHDERAFVLGSKDIVLPEAQTRLQMLSDVVGIPEAFPISATFSVGDLIIMAGAAGLVYQMMLSESPRGRKKSMESSVIQIQP